jgi:hypothetical protein
MFKVELRSLSFEAFNGGYILDCGRLRCDAM